MVTVLRMANIIYMMKNDHPWDRLEDLDHFGEGNLPKEGDHPKNGDQRRDGDPPRYGGRLQDFYYPME